MHFSLAHWNLFEDLQTIKKCPHAEMNVNDVLNASYLNTNFVLFTGPIPSGRLKNIEYVDKWSSLSLCLSVMGMSVTCELDCTYEVGWVI